MFPFYSTTVAYSPSFYPNPMPHSFSKDMFVPSRPLDSDPCFLCSLEIPGEKEFLLTYGIPTEINKCTGSVLLFCERHYLHLA